MTTMPFFQVPNSAFPWSLTAQQLADGFVPPPGSVEISAAEAHTLSNPPPPLDEVKAEKLAKIKADRNAAITGGFTYLNKPIDSDRDSVMAITGAAVAALAAKAAGIPYSVTWTCADDSTLTLDADGVLGMSITLAQFADAQHTKGRPLKDAIKNATAVDAVEAVAWG